MLRTITALSFIPAIIFPALAVDGEGTIVSQGITRSFHYHAPGESVAEGLPLVIVYHAQGETGQAIKGYSGFDAVSDLNGFLVVYPTATNIGGSNQWNAYVDEVSGHGGIGEPDATDDVIFTDDLIEHFCATYGIDASRIYATGFSNGGFMAYRLAVQRPLVFAAVAPVSGSLWGDPEYLTTYFAQQYEPVGIMHIHGDDDMVVDYPDPDHAPFANIWPLTAFGQGNCDSFSYESVPVISGVDQLRFCEGPAPDMARVDLIRLHGGEHVWPEIDGYDAAATIWLFFSEHEIDPPIHNCPLTGIFTHTASVERISVFPNPANGVVHFSAAIDQGTMLRVRDMSGRIVDEVSVVASSWNAAHLPAGMYLLELQTRDGGRQLANLVRE